MRNNLDDANFAKCCPTPSLNANLTSRASTKGNAHLNVAGGLSVNCAANRVARAKHLLHGAAQRPRHGALTHGASDVNHLVEGDVAVVLNVLHLFRTKKACNTESTFGYA